ncbi:sugar phosphate nucleotidyltransferase [Bacillus songklensis]|uniref:Sugar phosphate nucleotidyltransferase n=1 Tax=Bacillus songklensis TaxID=1069116 RepID=A0ABV8AZ50_9BACI
MKAIILAGGKGTRLRPLTYHTPKPMLPLLDKPVLEYTIEHLKHHGIDDIAITLSYLSDSIMNYFGDGSRWGVTISYFLEETPLGTAGAVKNAAPFINDSCLIVSGDALTMIDFQRALDYHKKKRGIMTIITKKLSNPFSYGIVVPRFDGKVEKMIEKPRRHEVLSDYINTGIYIIEPNVLSYIKDNIETDVSLDLIPLLLSSSQNIYHYLSEDYWIDIGEVNHYYQAQQDLLNRKCSAFINGQEIKSGIWLGENVTIERSASVRAPVFIGNHTVIQKDAVIGPHTVIASNGFVQANALIQESVLLPGVSVGKSSILQKAIIDWDRKIEDKERFSQGENVMLYKVFTEPVSIQSDPTQLAATFFYNPPSIINGTIYPSVLDADFYASIARALKQLWRRYERVVIGCEEGVEYFKEQIVIKLLECGFQVEDFHVVAVPLLQYAAVRERVDGAIYIGRKAVHHSNEIFVQFYEEDGRLFSRNLEWKLEQLLRKQEGNEEEKSGNRNLRKSEEFFNSYLTTLYESICIPAIIGSNLRVIVTAPHFIQKLFKRLCDDLNVDCDLYQEMDEEDMIKKVRNAGAHFAMMINKTGERFQLIDETGSKLTETESFILYMFNYYLTRNKLSTSVTISEPILFSLTEKVVRASLQRNAKKAFIDTRPFQTNAFYAFSQLLELAAVQFLSFSQLLAIVPNIHAVKECVFCPTNMQGRVMRKILEDVKEYEVELIEGMKIYHSGGWTLIMPDYKLSAINVYSEAEEQFTAQQFSSYFINKIKEYQKV